MAHSLIDADGVLLTLEVEAVWKSPLASTDDPAKFSTYLHRIALTLAREMKH